MKNYFHDFSTLMNAQRACDIHLYAAGRNRSYFFLPRASFAHDVMTKSIFQAIYASILLWSARASFSAYIPPLFGPASQKARIRHENLSHFENYFREQRKLNRLFRLSLSFKTVKLWWRRVSFFCKIVKFKVNCIEDFSKDEVRISVVLM